jgi:hypothetical protein
MQTELAAQRVRTEAQAVVQPAKAAEKHEKP